MALIPSNLLQTNIAINLIKSTAEPYNVRVYYTYTELSIKEIFSNFAPKLSTGELEIESISHFS